MPRRAAASLSSSGTASRAASRAPARATSLPRAAAPCACVAPSHDASGSPRTGVPRRAAGVDPALKRANLAHLRRIEGQVGGLLRMVEDDRYCAEVLTQIAAVRQSLLAVSRNLLRNHLTHCAAGPLAAGGDPAAAMIDELAEMVAKVAR